MRLLGWLAWLPVISQLSCGECLGNFACNSSYFRNVINIAPTSNDLTALTRLDGVLSKDWCIAMCFARHDCRSVVYNKLSKLCYHSSFLLNLTSGFRDTSSSYAELQTKCSDFNECSLSEVCSTIPMSRITYTGCIDARNNGNVNSGPYYIDPEGSGSFLVWCDFIGSEAWTVFQRRINGNISFYRGWTDYREGFGSIHGEYWLGLERIYRLTSAFKPKLNIYLEDFESESRQANYSFITISNETSFYQLTLGSYTGDAGDSFGPVSTTMKFSTYDRDNDLAGGNCAVNYKGAWWYKACHEANLNGLYLGGNHTTFADGINWRRWKGFYYSLRTSVMRIAV